MKLKNFIRVYPVEKNTRTREYTLQREYPNGVLVNLSHIYSVIEKDDYVSIMVVGSNYKDHLIVCPLRFANNKLREDLKEGDK